MGDDITYEAVGMTQADNTTEPMSFRRKLIAIQRRLKAPKNSWNAFGKYAYRNCEDVLEALKPLLEEYGVLVHITDNIMHIEDRFYVQARVTVMDADSNEYLESMGYAREPENRKGSDQSQVTGACSSYARKYALSAAFLIDDNKDPDVALPANEQRPQQPKQPPIGQQFVAHCTNCGTQYMFDNADYYQQWVQNPGCCPSPHWEVL